METPIEDIAAGELMNVLAAYRNKGLDAAVAAFADALRIERERCAQIADDRAVQWDAIKAAHPDDAAALARWLEACDIAALIRDPTVRAH